MAAKKVTKIESKTSEVAMTTLYQVVAPAASSPSDSTGSSSRLISSLDHMFNAFTEIKNSQIPEQTPDSSEPETRSNGKGKALTKVWEEDIIDLTDEPVIVPADVKGKEFDLTVD
jgi:hypothetical protein